DPRWSRKLDGPFHSVIFNVLSSQNTITLKNSVLKLDVGFQSNSRREDEGGGKISLNMLLTTGLYNLRWIKDINEKVEFILSNLSSFENNTNYGSRVIIPDADMFEEAVSGYFRFRLNKVIIETGAGLNDKWIKTLLTPGVNTPGRSIHPFAKNWITGNGLIGISYNPIQQFNAKLNFSTGFRAPNLAELSSNGLHEGIFHYELGDPNMKTEQNISVDLMLNYTDRWFNVFVSGFNNKFFNYIYLQQINRDFYGFPWYDYMQQDADLYGGDAGFEFTPQSAATGLAIGADFSTITGKTKDRNNLPYIPARKISSHAKYSHDMGKKVKNAFVSAGFDYVFAQNRPAPLETATPAYYLFSASIGLQVALKRTVLSISVTGNNLLNAQYWDHLSRFKQYGIYNIGRDIILNVGVPISFNYLTKSNKTKNPKQ
ncbi:MAG TPA: TonB-dependent receptor, partial [Chitinophagales bacterium]|nr:TonB-dependent receptor [Chitinophagales bacterium]